jgi:hypothetical protein
MKNFTSPSFFRLFDLLMSTHNPGFRRSRLTLDGLACARERHSFTGQRHGFAVDIFTFTRAGKRDWSLMVVKEYWWIGEESKDTKVLGGHARPVVGEMISLLGFVNRKQFSSAHRRQSLK